MKKAKVFLSYSHADQAKMEEFKKYLQVLELTDKAQLWTDGALVDGAEWDPAIKQALEDSDVIIVLISINSILSKYIRHVEMKRAYEKYKEGNARVICVILEDCPWNKIPVGIQKENGSEYTLGDFQAILPNTKAVYAADQPSLAAAMNTAYKRIEQSIDQFMQGK